MVPVYVDTSMDLIRQRLIDNRVTRHRGDVTDEVMATHQESFEFPEENEQAVRVRAESGLVDLASLSTTVRRLLNQ